MVVLSADADHTRGSALRGFGTGRMSAIELKAFLAAMEIVREANTAAVAIAHDLIDTDDDRSDRIGLADLPASRTIH
jgi:hypothetical protein